MDTSTNNTIITGMAEFPVEKVMSLERSITEKDQTIGALHETVANLNIKINDLRNEFELKQKQVMVTTGKSGDKLLYNPYTGRYENSSESDTVEFKNLDDVIEKIREEEVKRIGVDLKTLQNRINALILEKNTMQTDLEFKIKTAEAEQNKIFKECQKEREDAVTELQEELEKLKEDKTDAAVEEARKQEIINLKERITELETKRDTKPEFGWFKNMIYNWLDLDWKTEVAAKSENYQKQLRIKNISNNYPTNKRWWVPGWWPYDGVPGNMGPIGNPGCATPSIW